MVRVVAISGSLVIAMASLRVGLGMPAFGALINLPDWASFASAVIWLCAAISVAIWED